MPRIELFYLDKKSADQIEQTIKKYADQPAEDPEELYAQIIQVLPIQKSDYTSVRRRVEGLYYSTEILWHEALRIFNGNRQRVVQLAKLKPLSHYHYLTGSREPFGNVMTRADYLNDPSTALVKLKDDIIGLSRTFSKVDEAVS